MSNHHDNAQPTRDARPINLALQGGGSHGALTWGVLDRLLEDPRLAIAEISGTSAGAMNAVVLADGYARGGREGARQGLARFWKAVSDAALCSPIQRTPLDRLLGRYSLDFSPGYLQGAPQPKPSSDAFREAAAKEDRSQRNSTTEIDSPRLTDISEAERHAVANRNKWSSSCR